MSAYEHIYDPLEQTRALQSIIDTIALRPRVNTDSRMYTDSYNMEINVVREKTQFFKDYLTLQKEIETEANTNFKNFQELKFRKVTESILNDFVVQEQEFKEKRLGSNEGIHQYFQKENEDFSVKEKMRIKMLKEQ